MLGFGASYIIDLTVVMPEKLASSTEGLNVNNVE